MSKIKEIKKARWIYLALLPALIFLGALIGYPLVYAGWLSFHSQCLLRPWEGIKFVGLASYIYYFESIGFWRILGRTLIWCIGSVSLKLIIGMSGALLLNGEFKGKTIFRSLLIPSWVIPISIGAIVWSWLYNSQFGLINSLLLRLGIINKPFAIMGHMSTAFMGVLIVDAWVGISFMTLVILSGLQAIPKEFYEAAKVDGANVWDNFIYITLPQLKNVLLIGVLLSTIWSFNSFAPIWILTRGGPIDATTTLVIKAYKTTFHDFQFGRAGTLSVLIFIVLLMISYIYSRFIQLRGEGG